MMFWFSNWIWSGAKRTEDLLLRVTIALEAKENASTVYSLLFSLKSEKKKTIWGSSNNKNGKLQTKCRILCQNHLV